MTVSGGTLTLEHNNALGSGDIVLDGGTLATRGNLTIANTINLQSDSTLWSAAGSNSVFNGAIELGNDLLTVTGDGNIVLAGAVTSGAGSIIKQGNGSLTISGDRSGFNGAHRVEGGDLAVNGQLDGTIEVSAGGRLKGNGTVGHTTIAANGALAPGNSIGAITISGDLTFLAGGVYEVEVDPAGTASDHTHVTGVANLAGSVLHIGEAGNYRPFSSYRILTADGGLNGAFDSVSSSFHFLQAGLSYGANTVDLTLTRNDVAFASVAHTNNQRATAMAIDSLAINSAVYQAIVGQAGSAASVRQSYDQLSGELHASVQTALIEDSRFVRELVNSRLRTAAGTPGASVPVQDNDDHQALWLAPLGHWGSSDGDHNAAGLERDTRGVLAGADIAVGERSRIGLMLGYSTTDLDLSANRGKADIDSYHSGFYAQSRWDDWALRGGLFYSRHRVDSERDIRVETLHASLQDKRNADLVQGYAEISYLLKTGAVKLEPFARWAQVHLRSDDGTEQGGAAALHSQSENTDTSFVTLGLRPEIAVDFGAAMATVYGSVGWRHAFGDTTPRRSQRFDGGNALTIDGVPIAENTAVLEAGMGFQLSEQASLDVSYSGQFGDGVEDHTGQARFNWRF